MQRIGRATVMAALFLALGVFATAQAAEGPGGERGGRTGGRGAGFGGMVPGAFGGGFDKVALVRMEQVRKELKVTEEQAKKIDELLATYSTASRGLFQGGPGRDASDEERTKARAETTKKREELTKTTEADLAKIITKEQTTRLDEIVLQQKGVDVLVTESVVAALKVSPEQVTKIKAALKARDDEMAKLREGMRGAGRGNAGRGDTAKEGAANPFQEMQEKTQKIRKDAETACLALLTKEQSELFTKMKGAAFTIDMTQMRRGAMGAGGRGAGGAGPGAGAGGGARRRPGADTPKE